MEKTTHHLTANTSSMHYNEILLVICKSVSITCCGKVIDGLILMYHCLCKSYNGAVITLIKTIMRPNCGY